MIIKVFIFSMDIFNCLNKRYIPVCCFSGWKSCYKTELIQPFSGILFSVSHYHYILCTSTTAVVRKITFFSICFIKYEVDIQPVTVDIVLYHSFDHAVLQTLMTEDHSQVTLQYHLLSL